MRLHRFKEIQKDFRTEFRPRRIVPNFTAGFLIGFTEILFAVSLGSLIFSGELKIYLPLGISIAIASLAITTLVISLTSSVPGIVTGIQENPAVIQSVIVAGLVGTLSTPGGIDNLSTILAVLILTTFLSGLFLLALGVFKLGELIRYVPFPVIGGYLAGTGWLLVQASFEVMTGLPFTLSNLSIQLELEQLLIWLPGLILAFVMIHGLRRVDHILTMPGILFGAIILFYLTLLVSGTSIEEASAQGYLLGEIPKTTAWQPIGIQDFRAADWMAILGQSGNIATILVISVLSLLLNSTSLEIAIRGDININHELRSAGIANIFSGIGGGMVGFQALSESALSYRLGARGRLVGLVAASISILMLFTGVSLLRFFPKMLVGGMLLFLGLDFLIDWVITGWSKLSRTDFLIILLILFVIATTNFLAGFGVGLLAMVLLFVVNYSQINVVHRILTGAERRSNVERSEDQWGTLRTLGNQTLIIELQGYIFFGTAYGLLERVRGRVKDPSYPPKRFIILDFHRVSGLDSSAVFSFIKCRQLAESLNITVLFTGFPKDYQIKILLRDLFGGIHPIQLLPDLDRGLEWCEDRMLEMAGLPPVEIPTALSERLSDQGFPADKFNQLMPYLERIHLEKGDYLVHQGETAVDLYIIESGRLSVYLEIEDGKQIRLQTLSMRTLVGELGLYAGFERTASIFAEETSVVYRLSRSAMVEITRLNAELAAAFHAFVASTLARRLADTTRLLAALDQ
jgi:SulP family sulfate permease